MKEMVRMVLVIAILASFSGGLLASLKNGTKDKIEMQQLKFVKGPAIESIMNGCSNNPIKDRFKLKLDDKDISVFPGVFDGKANVVAFEAVGKGFGGDIGVMVGVDITTDKLVSIGVTTHSETPELGSKAKTDPSFPAQFKGVSILEPVKVKSNGGSIDALTGATVTSAGVCGAVTAAGETYQRLKDKIAEKAKSFAK